MSRQQPKPIVPQFVIKTRPDQTTLFQQQVRHERNGWTQQVIVRNQSNRASTSSLQPITYGLLVVLIDPAVLLMGLLVVLMDPALIDPAVDLAALIRPVEVIAQNKCEILLRL
ncbi:hypothetical protein HA402_004394 [Bradysia odoriphaga]|nr:hypothetical protein HA402_004394 [Bradysia odoriphaga]